MGFKQFSQTAVIFLAFCVAVQAGPVTYTLDTTGYNFQLDGGGGGAQATLNGTQNIEIYCVDYANFIYVPWSGYEADITTLTSGSNLSDTRFGSVSSWTTITNQNSLTMASEINTATDLGRYQMAAYLVSQYNMADGTSKAFNVGGNSTTNDGIQQAIWDILDPAGESFGQIGTLAGTDSALEAAASWYSSTGGNTGSAARDSFLANFRIVSDATMGSCGNALVGCGFQEQITVVPEPRHLALMLVGLLILGSAVYRRFARESRSNA
jgi:hypothetical protein